ncbi:branched-chain amino acid ABC transporter permease [Planosporangium thailandense]|uniref:Branched-chain amino acid ABC transporter permease n=1 Tax=Planosporangium thailandense TaxID=765197 RepID=A0ABX0Y363_9ACTN|nr:branched-chain amino acid ABC transporter permease [Planosporangium thailandense]NJC71855.1 branched-chain amino acid ABC transporter permease [Planosporangium thailandense]
MMSFYDSHLVLFQATFTGLILALSIQVPLRMGVFSFAGAGSYGIGAYLAAILVIKQDASAFVAIGAAMLATAVIGLLLGLLIFKLNGLYLAMATVAFDLIIGVIAINGGKTTGGSTGLYGVITDFTMSQLFTITLIALVLVALSEVGRTGRRVDAVRDDPELASSMGISLRRYRLTAFVVSGALGGLAGSMNVLVRSAIGPLDIGFGLIVLGLTMIVVGGSRSWKGAVIGAVIFTWLPDVLTAIGAWQELVYGIVVALAAVFLPRGIYGVLVDLNKGLQRRSRERHDPPPAAAEEAAGDVDPTTGDVRELALNEEAVP